MKVKRYYPIGYEEMVHATDYDALLALAGLMASEHFSTPKDFAIRCIRQADALLAELKEETK